MLFARAAQKAGADSIIAMAPARSDAAMAMEMFRRMADAYDGPIMLQNAATYAPLTGEQIAKLVEEVPSIEYIKEERPPGPKHIAEVHKLVGDKVKTIFGGFGGRFLPDELRRGANGCMPACEIADLLAKVMEIWWTGDRSQGTRPAYPIVAADQPGDLSLYALHPQTAWRLYYTGRACAGGCLGVG